MQIKKIRVVTGAHNLGKKKVTYTPDLLLSIFLSMLNYPNWESRIPFIEERHPNLKGHFTPKNLSERSVKHKWARIVEELRQQIMDEAKNRTKQESEDLLEKAIGSELDTVRDLLEEKERLMISLKAAEPGTKAYANIMSAIDRATGMIAKHAGTDRIRKREDLSDKVSAQLLLEQQKGQLKLTPGHVVKEEDDQPKLLDGGSEFSFES